MNTTPGLAGLPSATGPRITARWVASRLWQAVPLVHTLHTRHVNALVRQLSLVVQTTDLEVTA